ncbi:MAG TPA: protein kinase [Thermoanaerobaculia bacterium]|nr:protein kinase [Thermoanaerobaculia bacterium]
MTLPTGARLGPYEIVAPLGAGGMGEVYRARDTRLERTVAIKVLSSRLSATPEVRQRFEREAKTISQLSHPHICALHDVGREGETEYLVMEYLEGETLADRLLKGPLPLEQTLRYGMQIADALDKAHRQGIVHRDLKPGNVMITKSGVKLLDFGLAKALAPPSAALDLTAVPTQAAPVTQAGTLLGTVPYMAPEQLEGREADARTDIFAFGGVVLYEMATGRRAFSGTNQASLISSILRDDPVPISRVQPLAPRALDRIVRTCLAKDPEDRWQTARDVGLQLEFAASERTVEIPAPVPAKRRRATWLPWVVALVFVAVATASILRRPASGKFPAYAIRFSVPPPPNVSFGYSVETCFLAISPDGSQLAYVAFDSGGNRRIFLRPLSALEARPIAGTEGASSVFYSPDGKSVGFFAGDRLKRVELGGGAPVTICEIPPGVGHSGTWGRGGDILFASVQGEAIHRVATSGGSPEKLVQPDRSRGEVRTFWPSYLPDGKRYLYLLRYADRRGELMLGEPGEPARPVTAMQSMTRYVDPGYLVFAREGSLLAQRFDAKSGRVAGEPFSIAERVRYIFSTFSASFAASRAGTIAYQSEENRQRLAWFDRTGRELATVGSPGMYQTLAISRDARRILFDRREVRLGTFDIWSLDLDRATETPITSTPETECFPVWLPDGSIAYSVVRGSPPHLVRRNLATGKEEDILPSGKFQIAQDVSPDGKTLLYSERGENGVFDLYTIPLAGGKTSPFVVSPVGMEETRFSPDGRFVAMTSRESGRAEIYVTAYPGPSEKIRISTGGAGNPRWNPNGRELFYVSDDNRLVSVPVRTRPSLELGSPVSVFPLAGKAGWLRFEVAPDGKRFLAVVPEVLADELPVTVVAQWTAELPK